MREEHHLKDQIEAILDSNSSSMLDVIIRMEGDGSGYNELVPVVSQAMARRIMSTNARDLLPIKASSIGPAAEKPKTSSGRMLALADTSLLAQVASIAIAQAGPHLVQQMGLRALRPLLESDIVKRLIRDFVESAVRGPKSQQASRKEANEIREMSRGLRKGKPIDDAVTPIWASNSAVLSLERDDLSKLAQEVPNIQDIYPNRRLFVPPMVSPAELPQAVLDCKASAWGLRTIGALATWGAYGARGKGIKVGLLDTGVDADHPDLKNKIGSWAEFDSTGRLVANSNPHDTDQHGTHCAGIICGGNASGRWIGVAPEAEIAAALVLDGKRGGTDAQILAGLQWAIQQGVDVISMSLGGLTLGPDVPTTYTVSILNALRIGIPVVTAVGNHGSQTTGSPGNDFLSFSVGATDYQDRAGGFSGGRTHVIHKSRFVSPESLPLVYSKPEVSAPGIAVYSCVPNGKWAAINGTSMAAPHVAGAIALLLSATSIRAKIDPQNKAFLIQDLLSGSVEELGEAGQDHRFGFGRLDILRAIGFARELGY